MSILILGIFFGHWWERPGVRQIQFWWPTGSDGWMSTLSRWYKKNRNPMENTRTRKEIKPDSLIGNAYRRLTPAALLSISMFLINETFGWSLPIFLYQINHFFFQTKASVFNCVELKGCSWRGNQWTITETEWKRRKGRRMKWKNKKKKNKK